MKMKFVKKIVAFSLATAMCMTDLSGTGVLGGLFEVQAAETKETGTILKSWDFTDGITGWYYGGTGWEWQYTGADSDVEAAEGMLKANVDYSADGDKSWSQIGVCYGDTVGMSLAGADQVTFDFIYDSSIMTGGFNVKVYSSAGVDSYVAIDLENAVECSELGGNWKKATAKITFDAISLSDVKDWTMCLIGSNTTYKGAIYLDNISIEEATGTEEDIYVDATKVATATPEELSIADNKLNAYNATGDSETTDIANEIALVDGNADANTQALYAYLKAVGDSDSVIFGHQNDTWHKAGSSELSNSDTMDVTGSISGVVGIDALSLVGNEYSAARYNSEIGDQIFPETAKGNVAAAAALTNKNIADGAIITLSAHMPNFSLVEENDDYDETVDPDYVKYDFSGYSPNTLTGDVMNEILPGGEYNAQFNAYLDMIADYASQVNGTILFRPFHENTGSWFWWGAAFCDAQTYKNVYKYTVQYLRDEKNIHNILYVYGPGSEAASTDEYGERYPGDDYVDIVGFDMYNILPSDTDTWFDSFAQELNIVETFATAHNKLITVTETGAANSTAEGDNQTALLKSGNQHLDWYNEMLDAVSSSSASYFLLWANFGEKDGFYTPYVKSVKEDGTLYGHEELDYFVDFYNDARSIFAINQKTALDSLKDNIAVTASATTTSATGYITAPVSGTRILKPTTITAKVKGLGEEETVKFVLCAGDNQVDIPATLTESNTYTADITKENLAAIGEYVGSIDLYVADKKLDSIGATFNIAEIEEDPYEIDGFEGYSGVDSLLTKAWATNKATGSTISLSLTKDAGKFCAGSYGLKFSYNEKSDGWAGATISKEVNWSDCNALQFWTIPDGNKQKIVIQLTANNKVYEAYLNNYTGYTESTKPILVTIPFSEFVQRDTESHPAGGLVTDCSSVTSFGLWVNAIADSDAIDEETDMVAGTIYYDKITAINTDITTPSFGNVTVGDVVEDNATAYLIAQTDGNYYYEILPAEADSPTDGATIAAAAGAVTSGSGEEQTNETKLIYLSDLEPDTEYALYIIEKETATETYSQIQKVSFKTKKNAQEELTITGIPTENIAYGSTFSIGTIGGSNDEEAATYEVIVGSDYADVDANGKVTINGVGTVTIKASKVGNDNYEPVSTTTTFKSVKAEQKALSIIGVPSKICIGDKFTITKAGGSGEGKVTYKLIAGSEYAVLNTSTGEVEVTGIGTVEIQATKASDKNYKKTITTIEFTSKKTNQSVLEMTGIPTSVKYGDSFTLKTTGGNGNGAVTYAVTAGSGYASVNAKSGIVKITGVGSVTITATKAGDATHEAITQTVTFKSGKTIQNTLKISGVSSRLYAGKIATLKVTGGSGTGTVTYAVTAGSKYAKVDKKTGKISVIGIGSVTITATKAADTNYNAAKVKVCFQTRMIQKNTKITSGNLIYKVTKADAKKGTVSCIGSTSSKITSIKVPDTIKVAGISYQVTAVEKNAFKNSTKLKSAVIGNKVTEIGDNAFYKCTAITKITIGTRVKTLGKSVFYKDSKLASITIKSKLLKKVGSKAFKQINKKAIIKVPSSKVKTYTKLFKGKGQSNSVSIKK